MSDLDKKSIKNSLLNIEMDMEWLSKLIDVVSKGIGVLSAKFISKQITEGKKYEIQEIAQSIAEANKLPVKVSYEDGKINVMPKEELINPEDIPKFRAAEFLIGKETRRLYSTEMAALYAADELSKKYEQGEKVSNESIDDTWIANYFDKVGNIRDEKVLKIWGKLLAGQISQPGTFSNRILNLLSNINSEEASLIYYVINHTILAVNNNIEGLKPIDNFGLILHDEKLVSNNNNKVLSHFNCEYLASLGIIGPSNSLVSLLLEGEDERMYYCGQYGIHLSRSNVLTSKNKIRSQEVKVLTPLGLEFIGLKDTEPNEEYVFAFAQKAFELKLDIKIYDEVEVENYLTKGKNVIKELIHKTTN